MDEPRSIWTYLLDEEPELDQTMVEQEERTFKSEDGPAIYSVSDLTSSIDIKEEASSDTEDDSLHESKTVSAMLPEYNKPTATAKQEQVKEANSVISEENEVHSNEIFKCKICSKDFVTAIDLGVHNNREVKEGVFQCCACNKSYRSMKWLSNHFKKHARQKFYQCKICDKLYVKKSGLNRHLRSHVDDDIYMCEICDQKFSENEDLEKHRTTHSTDKPFVCKHCDRGFNSKYYLQAHERSHSPTTTKRSFTCEICSTRFWTSKQMMTHMMRKHPTADLHFQCIVCDKEFKEYSTYRSHLHVHKEKVLHYRHKCESCGKACISPSQLRNHMETHSTVKSHVCTICTRGFTNARYIKRHMKIHNGEKTYKCEVCEKMFHDLRDLNFHIQVHTGEKPFPCPTCGETFTRRKGLKRHISKAHTVQACIESEPCLS